MFIRQLLTVWPSDNNDKGQAVKDEKGTILDAPPHSDKNTSKDLYLVWVDGNSQQFHYRQLEYGEPYLLKNEYKFHQLVPVSTFLPYFIRPFLLYYYVLPRTKSLFHKG